MSRRSILVSILIAVLSTSTFFVVAQPPEIELLVRRFDGSGGRAKGDIVSMKAVPHKGWGKGEGPPNYVIVRIEGVSVKDFSQYHVRHGKLEESDKPETVRSRFRFDLDSLSKPVDGLIEIQKTTAISNVVDRRAEILSIR